MLERLPIIFWFTAFSLSLVGIFYLGLNPEVINSNWPYFLLAYNLIFSLFASTTLFFTIKRLKRNEQRRVLGSKFTWSFIKIIPILTIVPVLSFYLFSFQSIQETLEKVNVNWENFNKKIVKESSDVHDKVTSYVSKIYVDVTEANFQAIDGFIKYQLEDFKKKNKESEKKELVLDLQPILNSLVDSSLACKLQLFDSENNLIAESSPKKQCFPYRDLKVDDWDKNQPYLYYAYKTNNVPETNLIQTIVSTRYFTRSPVTNFMVLSSVHNVSDKTGNALISLEDKISKFKNGTIPFENDNPILRKKFLVDFSTTIALTVLAGLAIVLRLIDRLMRPLNNLSKGTREISKGNYDVKIETSNESSDLNLLINHFNEMSLQIKRSREGLDTHNLYLETILKYSYGVIALDSKKRIQFINPISIDMLGLEKSDEYSNFIFDKLAKKYKNLQDFISLILDNLSKSEWREEINIGFPEQNKLILCQGSRLRADSRVLGYVIVLNDITEQVRAQKNAAWGEVAMKMAHEVKNPLTPILLSADRLRNKFLDTLKGKELEIMEKTTSTIIDQVRSMSLMVEAFSEFANSPKVVKKISDINLVINQTIALYDADQLVEINYSMDGSIPRFYLDSEAINRLFINLIKNSIEASNSEKTRINIVTKFLKTKKIVKVIFEDDGEGFNPDIIENIFEPYSSTKITGTGLGLAIVQSIIEQHNGNIYAENRKPNGARIIIEIPIVK